MNDDSDGADEISSVVATTTIAAANVPAAATTTSTTTGATTAVEATLPAVVTIAPAAITVEEASIVPPAVAIIAAAVPSVVTFGGPPVLIAAADTGPATTIAAEATVPVATQIRSVNDDSPVVASAAAASDDPVMRSVEEELPSPAEAAVLVATEALNDEPNDQPQSSSSDNHAEVDDKKCEVELKEEKDAFPTNFFGADLILVNLESSLIHAQSHIETIILRDTFIGPLGKSHHHSSSDESSINIEYHGDNVVGCFDDKGNHVIGSSPQRRRLYGPVYTVRKYQPSTDVEMVYAVIIWADSSVKDKVEIEIASWDDYFELQSKS
jgi:hypothetical protein